jgi:excisionase family DNA binding protein
MSSPSDTPERLLTTAEAARLCSVNDRTIRRYATRGVLPARRLPGGERRYHRADVEALLTSEHGR